MFKSSTWLIQCDYCRFSIMMKYGFIDMDHFYIAAFVASSKLNDLSQNASQCCLKSCTSTFLFLKRKILISGPFIYFLLPPKTA